MWRFVRPLLFTAPLMLADAQVLPAQLTGSWGGVRDDWREKGFELGVSVTQFYQGITSGGGGEHSEYNGVGKAELGFDLGKLLGWNYWHAVIGADLRFGDPALTGTGGINPVNTAAIIPADEGTEIAVGALNFTRLFPIKLEEGTMFAVSFGRFNTVDLIVEDFFGGSGTRRFMNLAEIGPLTVLRQVPLVTNGISLAYIKRGTPLITFALLDPNDHSLDAGLSDLFADGVTFSPGIHLPTRWFGRTGKHSFYGAITTREYTPFDAIRQLLIPGPPLNPVEPQAGSWSVSYTLRQYIVERAESAKARSSAGAGGGDGWGLFGQVSFADQSTSPMTTFFDVGLGGNGLFSGRNNDEFGLAFAYSDLSEELKDNLDLLPLGGRLEAEKHIEVFYSWHIISWLQLTGDLQVIWPVRPAFETAIVPAARLRIEF